MVQEEEVVVLGTGMGQGMRSSLPALGGIGVLGEMLGLGTWVFESGVGDGALVVVVSGWGISISCAERVGMRGQGWSVCRTMACVTTLSLGESERTVLSERVTA
jgi:hypothetical protein